MNLQKSQNFASQLSQNYYVEHNHIRYILDIFHYNVIPGIIILTKFWCHKTLTYTFACICELSAVVFMSWYLLFRFHLFSNRFIQRRPIRPQSGMCFKWQSIENDSRRRQHPFHYEWSITVILFEFSKEGSILTISMVCTNILHNATMLYY